MRRSSPASADALFFLLDGSLALDVSALESSTPGLLASKLAFTEPGQLPPASTAMPPPCRCRSARGANARRFDERAADQIAASLAAIAGLKPRVRYLLERGRTWRSSKAPERARPLFVEAWAARAHAAHPDALEIDAMRAIAPVEPAAGQSSGAEREARQGDGRWPTRAASRRWFRVSTSCKAWVKNAGARFRHRPVGRADVIRPSWRSGIGERAPLPHRPVLAAQERRAARRRSRRSRCRR